MSVEEMTKFIGADSLAFVSIDGLYRAMGEKRRDAQRAAISAMPASPAITPSRSSITTPGKVQTQLSLLAETA